MTGDIRYEIQCRQCARHIGADSALEAIGNIAAHDAGHFRCAEQGCGVRILDGQLCCDDHTTDAMRQPFARFNQELNAKNARRGV